MPKEETGAVCISLSPNCTCVPSVPFDWVMLSYIKMAHSRDAQVHHLVSLQAKRCVQKTLPHLWYTFLFFIITYFVLIRLFSVIVTIHYKVPDNIIRKIIKKKEYSM